MVSEHNIRELHSKFREICHYYCFCANDFYCTHRAWEGKAQLCRVSLEQMSSRTVPAPHGALGAFNKCKVTATSSGSVCRAALHGLGLQKAKHPPPKGQVREHQVHGRVPSPSRVCGFPPARCRGLPGGAAVPLAGSCSLSLCEPLERCPHRCATGTTCHGHRSCVRPSAAVAPVLLPQRCQLCGGAEALCGDCRVPTGQRSMLSVLGAHKVPSQNVLHLCCLRQFREP